MTEYTSSDSQRAMPSSDSQLAIPPPHYTQTYTSGPLTVLDIKRQVNQLHEVMTEIMTEGLHYGHIPGTPDGQKALYKEGAEKLGLTFRLAGRFPKDRQEVKELANGHREYISFCEIRHIPSGEVWGEIERSCSTMESKYRWRKSARLCPTCGSEAIIKGQDQYGGGWLCWKKNGGCGAKFPNGDRSIEAQEVGKTENPDIADLYNTCLGMSQKRAHVAAMKLALACSDIFKQSAYEIDDEPVFESVTAKIEEDEEDKLHPAKKEETLKAAEKKEDLISDEQYAALTQALEDAKITPAALKIFLHNTFKVVDLTKLPAKYEEDTYRWIEAKTAQSTS